MFIEHIERNKDWIFSFKQKKYGKNNARDMWNKIITNMVNVAEPGLINWDNIIKNNSYYFDPITGCNPCSEAVLEDHGVCDLGSIVLPNFIANTNTNWKKLEETEDYLRIKNESDRVMLISKLFMRPLIRLPHIENSPNKISALERQRHED